MASSKRRCCTSSCPRLIAAPTSVGSSSRTRVNAAIASSVRSAAAGDQAEHVARPAADRAAPRARLRAPCAPRPARRRRTARCRGSGARSPARGRAPARGGKRRWRRGSRTARAARRRCCWRGRPLPRVAMAERWLLALEICARRLRAAVAVAAPSSRVKLLPRGVIASSWSRAAAPRAACATTMPLPSSMVSAGSRRRRAASRRGRRATSPRSS